MQPPKHPGVIQYYYKTYADEEEHFFREEIVTDLFDTKNMSFQGFRWVPVVKIVQTMRDGYVDKEEQYSIEGNHLESIQTPWSNCPK